MPRSSWSTPTGPGSRGGKCHDPEWRKEYYRRWRLNHPEYRERHKLRMRQYRARLRGEDPEMLTRLTTGRLPDLVAPCTCSCGCKAEIVLTCGLCRDELHEDAA